MKLIQFRLRFLTHTLLICGWIAAQTGGSASAVAAEGFTLELDGVNDSAQAPSTIFPNSSAFQSFTIEAWIYPKAAGSFIATDDAYDFILFSQPGAANNGVGIKFTLYSETLSTQSITEFRDVRLNQWNHVAVMFDAALGQMSIAINGILSSSPSTFGGSGFFVDPNQQFALGPFAAAGGGFFNGCIDAVRLSDVVRYSGASYTVPTTAFVPDDNTRALWDFNEPAGSTSFADVSGNGNNLNGVNGAQTGELCIDETTPPTVISINRLTPTGQATSAASVVWRVTFSEPVNNVSTTDFTLADVSGTVTGESITSVTVASGTAIDVTVATGSSGSGDLRLDVIVPGATITDDAGNSLNASFAGGQIYTIDRVAPTVLSINRQNPTFQITSAASVVYRVTFNERVNNVSSADFTLADVSGMIMSESINSVNSSSGTTIDVTVATGSSGSGDLRLDVVVPRATIRDDAGNSLSASFTSGEVYTIDRTPPTAPSITTQPVSQMVNVGQNASFTVTATGYPLNYQWRKDEVNIAGATGATCSLGLARTNQTGNYTVVVSNSAGSVTSAPPTVLTVNSAVSSTVAAWGNNNYGQTTVPAAAQSGVTAIEAGYDHTAALKNDGSVVAWGNNNYGQTTVPAAAQSGVTVIAAGGNHTVALKNDGSVVAWGDNGSGQTTVPVEAQSGVIAIAAGWGSFGESHTVALKNDGSLVAWGGNLIGQTTVPAGLSGVTAIAAGALHTVALKNDGSVVAWGGDGSGQTMVPVAAQSGVIAIAAGWVHTVALKNDGSVVAWGYNGRGQTTVPVAAQSGVIAIAAGVEYTLALKYDGSVVAWGDNGSGQTTVPVGTQGAFSAIAAGGSHTVVLGVPIAPIITAQPMSRMVNAGQSVSFTVTATGFPLSYQWRKDGADLAEATSDTYSLQFAQTNQAGSYTVVVSNLAGSVTSTPPAVLTVNAITLGTVVAWGYNCCGETTVPVAAQSGVTAIAAGNYHTVALKNDGSVLAWGAGTNNTGNYPDYGQSLVPVAAQSGVAAIAAGWQHTVALKNDGTVMAWGRNNAGQTTMPVGLSGVTAIAAGQAHTVALKNDGSVVAWGANSSGQTTVPVTAQSGVTAIAAGGSHTVALRNDGLVVAWGDNRQGQATVPVVAQSGVTAIAAGNYHTVALKNDGSVVAWGAGTNNTGNSPDYGQSLVPVAAQSGVAAIAAGASHTVALKNDGSLVVWGDNRQGQATVPIVAQIGVTAIAAGWDYTVALLGTGVVMPVFLNANHRGNEIILSWPTSAVGFTLQSTLDLTPPATWTDSTELLAVLGTQFMVTNTLSGRAKFYRLRKSGPP